ncbi:MAG: excinuclease ABC subunit UvrA, partial [Thermodesulfobacteriota bacterium]
LRRHKGEKTLIGFAAPVEGVEGKDPKTLFAELMRKGFIRVRVKGKLHDLSAGDAPAMPKRIKEVEVVVDRLVLKPGERARLVDSLETSFREGEGDAWVEVEGKGKETLSRRLRCFECSMDIEKPTPILFSFNHPVGACPECKGFGNILKYDLERVVPDRGLSLSGGAIEPWTKPSHRWWYEDLEKCATACRIDLNKPFKDLSKREEKLVFEGTGEFGGIDSFFDYLEAKKYKLHIRVFLHKYKAQFPCLACGGTRLKKSALGVRVGGLNIAEVSNMTIDGARKFFHGLKLTPFERELSKEAMKQLCLKLDFLVQTGLGYITLDRLTRTLSGGEAQRAALSSQLASALSGVLYILDEPSIGLHPRDIEMLIQQMKKLSLRGNTVVVVEHDPSVLKASEHIIELGPGAGTRGGRLVYSGPTDTFLENANTLTSDYLRGRKAIHTPRWRRKAGRGRANSLFIKGASGNNLKELDVRIPLKTLTCVTGVSGSGKSTLVVDTLYNALAGRFGLKAAKPLPHKAVEGAALLEGVKLINQEPIGKTPRSNPITYIGGFDEIRRLFAGLPGAVSGGLTTGNFSFNVPGGRCDACKGEGVEKLEMYFLPDVYISCGNCGGKRYKPRVLEVKYHGKNIHDVLRMTFDDAAVFLPPLPGLDNRVSIMREVGLGYLTLGQPATTLSGGEAQRLKIARELISTGPRDMLYILDEPTTGLHMDDTKKLLSVLGRLVDSGNTVLIIEHNLELIKTADHVIDLGPEGGDGGGTLVTSGTPEKVASIKTSHTGRHLKTMLG